MSACDRLADRLYDEDVRSAQRTGRAAPADLRRHLRDCARCATLWRESAADLALFGPALAEPPAPGLSAAAARAMREAFPEEPLIDWRAAAAWGLCGAGLAGCALVLAGTALPFGWQCAALLVATAVGLGAELTRQGLEAS